eukprot:SAG31_NODE_1204_length_9412_cov_3.727585_4_plen_78_part_00
MALNSMLAEADYRGVDAAASGAEVVFRSGLPRFGPGQGGCTVYSRNGIDPKPPSRVGPVSRRLPGPIHLRASSAIQQ